MKLPEIRLPVAVRLTIWFSVSLLLVLGLFAWFALRYTDLADPGWTFAGGLVGAVVVSKVVGYVLARRVLSPIAHLTRAARQIEATDLSRRLPEPEGPDDEITDLARTFNEMLDRLEDSIARERQFAEDVAHELLTPLAKLRPEIEMVARNGSSEEELRDTLDQVVEDIDDLTQVVRGLMDLARADLEESEPCEPVDMAAIARECVRDYRDRAEERMIELRGEWEDEVEVRAEAVRLREVFANLLENAIKYTPEGGEVEVAVRRVNGWGRVRVQDTGIGFEPEMREQIFERFERGNHEDVRAHEGSGLGLAIVQSLVEGWGGRVWAASSGRGSGATFTVDLPRNGGRYDPTGDSPEGAAVASDSVGARS